MRRIAAVAVLVGLAACSDSTVQAPDRPQFNNGSRTHTATLPTGEVVTVTEQGKGVVMTTIARGGEVLGQTTALPNGDVLVQSTGPDGKPLTLRVTAAELANGIKLPQKGRPPSRRGSDGNFSVSDWIGDGDGDCGDDEGDGWHPQSITTSSFEECSGCCIRERIMVALAVLGVASASALAADVCVVLGVWTWGTACYGAWTGVVAAMGYYTVAMYDLDRCQYASRCGMYKNWPPEEERIYEGGAC